MRSREDQLRTTNLPAASEAERQLWGSEKRDQADELTAYPVAGPCLADLW